MQWCFCQFCLMMVSNSPANIYLFKVNNRNTRKSCEICSKLTIKTPERRQQVNVSWESVKGIRQIKVLSFPYNSHSKVLIYD